ncbi:hypothetical protein SUGI_0152200 [Cryptomeria japonica]|uniref:uncharacterized protein LOC131026879 n=1 Tax=Cryptomeria japonica TaxID=3369 RepID=UPI002408E08C|nr:uncharacterized protein LOC131026879 [Cryptomeria japonica]GLJ11327.1 hypothetical protein SUGI_0152200 [Cryptomeria japonica]
MFEKREEFLWPQAELREESSRKWPWLKAVVGVTSTLLILSASVLLAGVHPANIRTAEFVSEVSKWMQSVSSSSFCPCLYVILNILILILGVKSTSAASSPPTSASPSTISSHYCPCQCSQLYHKPESTYETLTSPSTETLMVMKSEWKAEETQSLAVNGEQMLQSLSSHKASDKVKAAETHKAPALVLPRSCSLRELHCKKVSKPSNLSRESSHTRPLQMYKCGDVAPVEVIFEICSGEEGGDGHGDKEKDGNLTCEELNAKAESFIGNFYRELKMQREDSWKRLCAIYRKSC